MTLLLLLLHAGCFVETQSIRGTCSLDLALEPAAAEPGDRVALRTTPQTAPYDTVIFLDDQRLVPDDIEEGVDCDACLAQSDIASEAFDCDMDCPQDACDQCSVCREESFCGPCERCLPCAEVCSMCDERAYLTLPDELEPGVVDVLLTNKYGTTNKAELTILEPSEPIDSGSPSTTSDTSDTADSASTSDSGPSDTGASTSTTSTFGTTDVPAIHEEEVASSVRP